VLRVQQIPAACRVRPLQRLPRMRGPLWLWVSVSLMGCGWQPVRCFPRVSIVPGTPDGGFTPAGCEDICRVPVTECAPTLAVDGGPAVTCTQDFGC
jgi:hypothetical protein